MEFYNFAGEESSRKLTSIKQSLLGIQVSNANYAIEILSNEEERFIFARVTLIFLIEVEGDLWKDHVL